MNFREKLRCLPRCARYYTSSLMVQLVLVMILLISAPTLIFTSFYFQQQNTLTQQRLVQNAFESSVQIANQINSDLKSYTSVSNLFYLDDALNQALLDYQEGRLTIQEGQRLIRRVSSRYNAATSGGLGFSVLTVAEDGTTFGNALITKEPFVLPLMERDWYQELFATQTRQLWIKDAYLDHFFSNNGYDNIYLVRKLHNRQNWTCVGTLLLIISELEIERIYSSYVGKQQSLFLLDQSMGTISSVDNLNIYALSEEIQSRILNYSGTFSPAGAGPVSLVSYYTIVSSQWKLVYCHNTDSAMHPFEQNRSQYLRLITVCLIISVLLSTLVVHHYISPIKILREQMDEVQKGNLNSHLPVIANNEIGQLTAHFNRMQDSIHLLMQRLIEESEAKRSAEIQALQSQINPHFLYNTLASVRFMIFSGETESADAIVVSLIHLMKNALSNAQLFVTIDMELHLLDDYIRIQQYTFAHPFQVEIDVEPEVRDCYTIKLLLQPIVENAIFHGLKPKTGGGGLLRIFGRSVKDGIELVIQDNGVGFDAAQGIRAQSPMSHGIGLQNVIDRIHLHFGNHYGARVSSTPGRGTEIRIHLPKLRQEEDCKPYERFNC